MRILLDTSAYSQLKRGHAKVAEIVRGSRRIHFSPVVGGELLYGFHRGSRTAENVSELRQFLESPFVTVEPLTMVTADRFARIAASLRGKGRLIPTNDMWVAAQAMEVGTDLVSFDEHFGEIEGLVWINPE